MRRVLEIVDNWPGPRKPGPLNVPPHLAAKHGYRPGEPPSDALLENMALHYATTVYHLSCTCRIGSVVDSSLKVFGVQRLRVADASIMPEIVSGNTNAASIMIGEKAAEMVAADHGVRLNAFVGERAVAE
jgi:choline dehydrogenase-like flavoprotein